MDHDSRLLTTGRSAWAFMGIAGALAIVYLVFAQISGLVVPLVVAAVVGMLFAPVVDRLARFLPRQIASILVLLGLVALGYWTLAITINGIIGEAAEIREQVQAGVASLVDWLGGLGWEITDPENLAAELEKFLASLIPGLTSVVGSAFSSAVALLAGTGVALFFLYFVLADWDQLTEWIGGHLGVPRELGEGMIEDTVWSMRQYFYILTGSSLLTAILTGLAMVVMGLPLAAAVAIVTFVTSYVPYLGAIFSGTFAFLVALGAGGLESAVIILIVILVVQNVVQPLVLTKYTGDALRLHPMVVFGSTIVGAAIAGILGATLSAPIVAMMISVNKRINASREHSTGPVD